MSSMIEFQDVSFSYKHSLENDECLFRNLSFCIEHGTLTTIIGKSGSGKTTLLNLIAGFLRPQEGTIRVDGDNVSRLTSDDACKYRNKKIGFVYQSFHLLPEMTALQNVMLPLIIAKKSNAQKKSEEAMRTLGILEKAESFPPKMSGGEQQRTAIARAIVNDADVILADEPTGNLDSENAEAVKGILKKLSMQGKTIVIVSHDISFTEIADHVINTGMFRC